MPSARNRIQLQDLAIIQKPGSRGRRANDVARRLQARAFRVIGPGRAQQSDREDLVQDTMVDLLPQVAKIARNPSGYVGRIARAKLWRHWQQQATRRSVPSGTLDDASESGGRRTPLAVAPDRVAQYEETEAVWRLRKILVRALSVLTERQLQCVHLVYFEGLKLRQAASVLRLAPGTVGGHLGAAQRALLAAIQGVSPRERVQTATDTDPDRVLQRLRSRLPRDARARLRERGIEAD